MEQTKISQKSIVKAKYRITIPTTEKPITPNKILPLSMLIHLRSECKGEKAKKALDKIIKEYTGEIRQEIVEVEFTRYGFPLIPILEELIKNKQTTEEGKD